MMTISFDAELNMQIVVWQISTRGVIVVMFNCLTHVYPEGGSIAQKYAFPIKVERLRLCSKLKNAYTEKTG